MTAPSVSPRTLLVFVPGIMGSRLSFPSINNLYWDPDSYWRMLDWYAANAKTEMGWIDYTTPAKVMSDDNDGELSPDEVARGWGGVYWDGYGRFLRWLDGLHLPGATPIHCVGYDWRQTNYASAADLIPAVDLLLQANAVQQLIFLTHSMGGLVVRSALQQNVALVNKTRAVIHVAQPVAGAVAFYRRFYTGALAKEDGGSAFATILGNDPDKYTAIVSGVRGAFELLPNDWYVAGWRGTVDAGGAHTPWMGSAFPLYRDPTIPPGLPDSTITTGVRTRVLTRVQEAETFHSQLQLFMHANTYSIAGNGARTDTQVFFDVTRPNSKGWVEMIRPAEGDETVPERSAARLFQISKRPPFHPSNRQYEVSSPRLTHSKIYLDSTVQDLVKDILSHTI